MKTPQPESKPRHRLTGLFRWKRVVVFVFLLAVLLEYIYWPRPLSVEERQFVGTWEETVRSQPELTHTWVWKFFPDRTLSFVNVIHRQETADIPATQRVYAGINGKWKIRNGNLHIVFRHPGLTSVSGKLSVSRTLKLVRAGALGLPRIDEGKLTFGATKDTCDVSWWDYGTKSYDPPKEWKRVSGSDEAH